MKRLSIVSKISWATFLILPVAAISCSGDSDDDLFRAGNPKPDSGGGAAGGQSGAGGSSAAGGAGTTGMGSGGTGARSSGGSAGRGDASAGSSGTGTGAARGSGGAVGTNGTAGSAGTGGAAGTGGSGATDANAGTAGTTGTGGSAGSAGTSGSAGSGGPDASGGTAGADAGSDAGSDSGTDAGSRPCANNSQCKSDEFCSKLSCALLTGECKARPKTCPSSESPVCGCDAVNYWNDCLRQQVGTAASTAGECLTPATCGGVVGYTCPLNRASCAHLLTTQLQCGVADAFGTCWVIPEQCPSIVIGSTHRPCSGTDRCLSKCEAIKTEHDFFADSTCPQ